VVLMMEFRGYQSKYVASLPPVDETPLFRDSRLPLPVAGKGLRDDPQTASPPSMSFGYSCLGCSARSSPRRHLAPR
jgi:hypothetical protein